MRKAIILAAGRGTRMGDLTIDVPKPMLPIAGQPMLEHVLERLRQAGIREALLVTGYRAEVIEEHFRDHPLRIEFRRQLELNGTARAALLGRDFAGPDPFLFTFGDILCSPEDYRGAIAALHYAPDVEAVAGVKQVDDPWKGAAVYEENGRVTRIVEKPPPGTSATRWNSAGLYICKPIIFEELETVPLSARGEYEFTSAVAQLLAAGKHIRLYPVRGDWRDVGRPEDLEDAAQIAGS